MGFIKRIFGKIDHLVIDLVGDLLADPVVDAARHPVLRISVDKTFPLFFHDGCFFLGHGTAQKISTPQRITRQRLYDLHDLLLINDAPVSLFQDRFQQRRIIGHGLRMVLSFDVLRNKIHRSRTVQGDSGDDVFQAFGFQLLHEVLHAAAFQLEHTFRLAGADHFQYFRIVVIDGRDIYLLSAAALRQMHRILDDCQCTQPQEIHLQKPQFLQRSHRKLGNQRSVTGSGQGDIFVHRLLADHDACRMHGGMARQSLQTAGHVDQVMDLIVRLVQLLQLMVHGQRLVDGDIQLRGDHLCDGIHLSIRHIQHTPHITDHTARRQRTESNDLNHPVFSIFSGNVVDDFLAAFKTEIHVDIRHRHTFRIQETLKQELIAHRVQLCDPKRIGNQAARRRSTPGTNHNLMVSGEFDEIPHDQEVIHISHGPDGVQLIVEPFLQLLRHRIIETLQSLTAELVQIFPCGIAFRHIEPGKFRHAEFNVDLAAVRDLLSIFQRLQRIGEQTAHLLFRFDVVLSAFIAHTVFIADLLARLDTEKDVVGIRIRFVSIVNIIGRHQFDARLLAHPHQLLVDQALFGNSMILQFQKEISLSENLLITQRGFFSFFVKIPHQITGNFSREAGAQGNDTLVVLLEDLHVHTGLIIEAIHIPLGDDFGQIGVSKIILCQKHQMIVTFFSFDRLPVKAGSGSNIHFTSQDGFDPGLFGCLIKIDTAEHHAMVRDGGAVHPEFFDPGDVFFDFIGSVQKTVFCMDVKMCKAHWISFPAVFSVLFPIVFSAARLLFVTVPSAKRLLPSDPDFSVSQLDLFFLQQVTDGTFEGSLAQTEFPLDNLRGSFVVERKDACKFFYDLINILRIFLDLLMGFCPGRQGQFSVFFYVCDAQFQLLPHFIDSLCFAFRDKAGILVVHSDKDTEIIADLINQSFHRISDHIRRTSLQERIDFHRGAQTAAFIQIQRHQHLVSRLNSSGLFPERQHQIFLQSPVQKSADLSCLYNFQNGKAAKGQLWFSRRRDHPVTGITVEKDFQDISFLCPFRNLLRGKQHPLLFSGFPAFAQVDTELYFFYYGKFLFSS